jgi:hypothetical protein
VGFRDEGDAQRARIEALEAQLEEARDEAARLREERDRPQASRPSSPFPPGTPVAVEWHGSWWNAHVLEEVAAGAAWKIRYDGYSSRWDEIVGPERIAPRSPALAGRSAGVRGAALAILALVLVLMGAGVVGFFLLALRPSDFSSGAPIAPVPASISASGPAPGLEIEGGLPPAGTPLWILWGTSWYAGSVVAVGEGQLLVHYEGWSSTSDEWVPRERVRWRR